MDKKTSDEHYQEYLEVIFRIAKEKERKDAFISNAEIAASMKVKPPSVTEFLAKLKKEGLIEYEKRQGVRLTSKGFELGNKVLEMHHLLESFFTKVLELDDKNLKHRLACAIEHDLMNEPRLVKALEKSIKKVEAATPNQP